MAKTIILIDDDQDDLDIMKDAIREIDKSILSICFLNPEAALEAIENELIVLPDFVFVDINMSPFTGDKCLKELRKNPELQDTKIVMFSTSIPKTVAQALIESGANFAFEKPSQFEAFRNIISQVLLEESDK